MNDTPSPTRQSVLFVCTHNSARSQMAEGLMRAFHGDRFEAASAGTTATRVHPLAVEAMAEIGIDISGHRSKTSESLIGVDFDCVVTVCDSARENCPYFPGSGRRLHRSFEDPAVAEGAAEERLEVFRRVREEIRTWLQEAFG